MDGLEIGGVRIEPGERRRLELPVARLLLERTNPDPLGTRFIILPYANIAALKLVDVIKEKTFSAMGFEGKLTGK